MTPEPTAVQKMWNTVLMGRLFPVTDRAGDGSQLVDTVLAAKLLDVPQGTVRSWASHGVLPRSGKDDRGRTLYALADVEKQARILGLLDDWEVPAV